MNVLLASCLGDSAAGFWDALIAHVVPPPPPVAVNDRQYAIRKKVSFQPPGAETLELCRGLNSPTVHGHAVRVLAQLGEGGYAYVYLVQEVPSPTYANVDTSARYALKKVLANSEDALAAARREASIQQEAAHPCILPLLDWAVVPPSPGTPDRSAHIVYMLSPAYLDGTLHDELTRLGAAKAAAMAAEGRPPGDGGPLGSQGVVGAVLPTRVVLCLFRQLCAALEALHARGYAHRDVKVHNILIRRPGRPEGGGGDSPRASGRFSLPFSKPGGYAQLAMAGPDNQRVPYRRADGVELSARRGSDGRAQADGPDHDGTDTEDYHSVLMDFGSAAPRVASLGSRQEAQQLQEDAEAHCTATFRAPELWDAPWPATLDQAAADVWAAGCTLFAAMYGQSPFQLCLNQGASLALAVANVSVPWPRSLACCYPPELHDLVTRCLALDPAARPSAADLAVEAAGLLARGSLPDPPDYKRYAAVLQGSGGGGGGIG